MSSLERVLSTKVGMTWCSCIYVGETTLGLLCAVLVARLWESYPLVEKGTYEIYQDLPELKSLNDWELEMLGLLVWS